MKILPGAYDSNPNFMSSNISLQRLHVVDALRGFAIVSIMLLHNIEHFDVYYFSENLPEWMKSLDSAIWGALFFLFSGKSYAIFALLFGLTFHIQSKNQKRKGNHFSVRFAWRMVLLFSFGIINSAFFEGDILNIYAALGLLLIPLGRLNDKAILIVAILLLLLPLEWVALFQAIQNPNMVVTDPVSWSYFGKMLEYVGGNSFIDTAIGNLTNGKTAVLLWNLENGRYFLILSLFLFGILAGRKKLFAWGEATKSFWKKALIYASIVFIVVYISQLYLDKLIESKAITRSVNILLSTWSNTSFMVVLVAGFCLLFHSRFLNKPLNYFSSFGKMSLSNYVFQSILGSFIYYGFGLGLYQYTGATYGVLIGIALTILLGLFCSWWEKNNKRGPLETIWHKLTWVNFNPQAKGYLR